MSNSKESPKIKLQERSDIKDFKSKPMEMSQKDIEIMIVGGTEAKEIANRLFIKVNKEQPQENIDRDTQTKQIILRNVKTEKEIPSRDPTQQQ